MVGWFLVGLLLVLQAQRLKKMAINKDQNKKSRRFILLKIRFLKLIVDNILSGFEL